MGAKVKGFFKGLKVNLSNIFDEGEEEAEIQIGMPTDVKHVAHIGADGPSNEPPTWMNKFDGGQSQSGPLDMASGDSPAIKKGTKKHRVSRSEELTIDDLPDGPKPSRRHRHHRSMDTSLQDPEDSQHRKRRRRHRIRRRSHDKGDAKSLPDIPNKSRRKEDDGSTQSRDSESPNNI